MPGKPPQKMSERTLDVLLIDDDERRAQALQKVLDASRYRVSYLAGVKTSLLKEVDRLQPDVVVIDVESPNRDMLESVSTLSSINPKPIVMFAEQSDTDTINRSVSSGVSAYVAGDIDLMRVRAILDAAVARFDSVQHLRQQLQDTQKQLHARQVIDKAKRLLMESKRLSEQDAFAQMRTLAMQQSKSIEEIAEGIVSVFHLLK